MRLPQLLPPSPLTPKKGDKRVYKQSEVPHNAANTPTPVAPPEGRLGVLIPGMGAVATTFIGGVLAIRRGLGKPIGALSQMGTLSMDRAPSEGDRLIRDVVPLARLDDLVFGGWDIFDDDMYAAAVDAGVLAQPTLDGIRSDLQAIRPMPAVFDRRYVNRLDGRHTKSGRTKMDLADQVRSGHPGIQSRQRPCAYGHDLVRQHRILFPAGPGAPDHQQL